MGTKAKTWIEAATVRAIKTMAQTAVAMLPVAVSITEIDWWMVLGTAALAGVASILTSLAGLPEVEEEKAMAEQFIEQIASLVRKYAPQYGILVHSPIIAQAILESASGTSELAVNAHNYFGLKYKASVASEHYIKVGSEQNTDGSYTSSVMKWCKFPDMEAGVKGYFDFISAPRYANLKGVTSPETYLQNIKADGYATSIYYVPNLLKVIEKYNLIQYDTEQGASRMARVFLSAGHGGSDPGAVAYNMKEKDINLQILLACQTELLKHGVTVIASRTSDENDAVAQEVAEANASGADIAVSFHINAGKHVA